MVLFRKGDMVRTKVPRVVSGVSAMVLFREGDTAGTEVLPVVNEVQCTW